MRDRTEALKRALEKVGGGEALAGKLNVTPQAVSQWEKVPALRVIAVEQITGISRHELRPDIYPLPETAGAA